MVLSDGAANAAVAAERARDARPSLRGRGTILPDCRWAWDATAQRGCEWWVEPSVRAEVERRGGFDATGLDRRSRAADADRGADFN